MQKGTVSQRTLTQPKKACRRRFGSLRAFGAKHDLQKATSVVFSIREIWMFNFDDTGASNWLSMFRLPGALLIARRGHLDECNGQRRELRCARTCCLSMDRRNRPIRADSQFLAIEEHGLAENIRRRETVPLAGDRKLEQCVGSLVHIKNEE